jgi:hypothetical protein
MVVTIGDGKTVNFWTSSWVEGTSPKSIVPNLFRKSKRKKIMVQKALQDNRWVARIQRLQTVQELHEYAALWERLQETTLEENSEDTIHWRWIVDGEYTTKSAYNIQFVGSFSNLKLIPIWKAQAEPKCRFFAWTLLHKKILTANHLMKRNWANDPICKLCGIDPETPTHLCKDCTYSKQIWSYLKQWLNLSALNSVGMNGSLHGYWRKCQAKFDRSEHKKIDGVMIYFW